MRARFFILALLFAFCATSAAQTYPAKPITVVVPYSGGGPTDAVGRLLAEAMGKALKTEVAVENIGGAGGTVGAAQVAKAANDGYTLLLDHIGHATAPALYAKLTFDPINGFEPIGRVADVPMTVVARGNLEARDFKELASFVRAGKGKVKYAHAGIGAASHLCGLLLAKALNADWTTVAYKGTGPAMRDLLTGYVDLMCDQTTNTLAQIKAGRIKPYAVTTSTRLPALKDVPTLAEAGLKGFDLSVWHGLYAPRGTPKAVIDRLAAALQTALKDPALVERLAEFGATPAMEAEATPGALQDLLKKETARWADALKGLRAE